MRIYELIYFLTRYYLRVNNKNLEECHKMREKCKFNFVKIVFQQAVEMFEFFNQNVDVDVFRTTFENFKPKIDYYNAYLKILNSHFPL